MPHLDNETKQATQTDVLNLSALSSGSCCG